MKNFNKYQECGAYHWEDIKKDSVKNLLNRSVPTLTRYNKILSAVPKRARRIVDIGCGDGALTYLLSKNNKIAEVLGCDTDCIGIKLAQQKIKELPTSRKIQLVNKSFEECEFENQSIDVITMCDVIEHVEGVEHLLKEIKRTLKKGGSLIITTPFKRSNNILWDENHVLEYTNATLNDLLTKNFPKTTVKMFSPTPMYWIYYRCKTIYNILYLLGLNPLKFYLESSNHTMLFSVSHC